MKRIMFSLSVIVLLVIVGCSGGGGGGSLLVAYNTVYGVNALSTDENISLYVGDEMIETVVRYDENASIIEKAVGSDNIAFYTASGGEYGHTSLQNSRTYFYAATDCNDSLNITQDTLTHIVETDIQINIVNTSSDIILPTDVNISIDGVKINTSDIDQCAITAVDESSTVDQNITVVFSGGGSINSVLPSDATTSVDIIIYNAPLQKAAIISLPRLTSDAR